MSKPSWPSNKFILIMLWIAGIAVRLYGAFAPAHYYDMVTFEAWSRSFWVHGAANFFSSVWSDYLPLPIMTFAPISLLADLFKMSFGLTFKLLHITIELVLIYAISRSSRLSLYSLTKYLVPLLLLSPALIGDTSFWGQVDTVPSLLALLSLTTSSPLLFGLAVAYKPIIILIAPVLWIKDLREKRVWWRFPLISSLVFLSSGIPTGGFNFFTHLLSRALAQSGTYPFLTVNAFNFWSLVPNLSWIADSTSVFGVSGHTFGLIAFACLTLVQFNHWRRTNFDPKYAAKVASVILILFFTFTTRMHERHLLFGLPFMALAAVVEPWLLAPYFLLTASFTLNLYGAFYWVDHSQVWPFSLPIISLISWVTVVNSILLATVWSWSNTAKSFLSLVKSHKLLIGILVLATLIRLVGLSHPKAYIFDEVYHSFTAREYLHNHVEAWEWWTTPPPGVAYEWTHPPVAKYGMVLGMLLVGENSLGWRLGSALFGIASILGLYLLIMALTKNRTTALVTSFLVSIEGLHLSQSRVGMNDTYMLCFYIWSLYLAVKFRWKGAAILYGLSLASKWSALYGVVPLAFIYLSQNPIRDWSLKSSIYHILFALRSLLIAGIVYILTFTPFILAGHTWQQWIELHRQMWYYHTHLVATHGYQSTPLQWIFAARPVWYYVQYLGGEVSNIYAQSNPLILWLGLVALILQFRKILSYPYTIFYLLYAIFTLPWIFSPRIMFFYHYLPSSVFLCIILASWLSTLSARARNILLALCLLITIAISPMLYGFPTPNLYWDTLFKIFPSWK